MTRPILWVRVLDELQQSAVSPSARRTSRTCRHRAGHFNLLTTNARYVHNKGLVGNAMFCYCHISLCAKVGNRSNLTPSSAFVGFTNVGYKDWSNIDNLRRISLGRASCLVPRASRLAPRTSRLVPAPRASRLVPRASCFVPTCPSTFTYRGRHVHCWIIFEISNIQQMYVLLLWSLFITLYTQLYTSFNTLCLLILPVFGSCYL